MKRGHWQILLAAALFLLALGLTLYPVVSNWYIGRHQSRIQTEYREVLEQTDSAEIESIRESAVAYTKPSPPERQRRPTPRHPFDLLRKIMLTN